MNRFPGKIFSCDRGAVAVEYGLIIALVVIVSIGAISAMSSTVVASLDDTSVKVSSALSN